MPGVPCGRSQRRASPASLHLEAVQRQVRGSPTLYNAAPKDKEACRKSGAWNVGRFDPAARGSRRLIYINQPAAGGEFKSSVQHV